MSLDQDTVRITDRFDSIAYRPRSFASTFSAFAHFECSMELLLIPSLALPSEIPEYTPGAAYRHLEFLLGRIDSLQDKSPFTAL